MTNQVTRESDGTIFSVGDRVDLIHNMDEAGLEVYTIAEFQSKKGGNKWFPDISDEHSFNVGDIITNKGVIRLENAYKVTQEDIDRWDERINLSIRDLYFDHPKLYRKLKLKNVISLTNRN